MTSTYNDRYQQVFGAQPSLRPYGDPVSYYANDERGAASAFVKQYGTHLEHLARTNLLACLSVLAKVSYCVQAADDAGEITDWSVASELSCGYLTIDSTLRSLLLMFDSESIDEAEAFCSALTNQILSRPR